MSVAPAVQMISGMGGHVVFLFDSLDCCMQIDLTQVVLFMSINYCAQSLTSTATLPPTAWTVLVLLLPSTIAVHRRHLNISMTSKVSLSPCLTF